LRRRLLLVRQRTLHLLSLQSLIARYTGERLSANGIKKLDVDAVLARLGEPIGLGGQISCLGIQWLDRAIGLIEHEVYEQLRPRPEYRLLTSVPGIGQALGSTIALETGSIEGFPGSGNYASYAHCVKPEKISNGKLKGRRF
jgi:hypothetical protein